MSDEEQIALETLKEVASDDFDTLGDDISPKMAQNILNLINKQQKEIEKYEQQIDLEFVEKNFIEKNKVVSKDKIREVLKDLDEFDDYFFNVSTLKEATKNSLKQLLEEN